jgi:DNA (cytosine-5)-methyltransferase 1
MAKLSVIDLFAGGGGFSEGFRQAGYDVRACVEIDKWAADTLRHNFPEATVIEDNIRDIRPADITRKIGKRPNVIIGGPPCQGFSVAGPTKDPNDPRNTLFMNYATWVEELRPDVFVMENVHGMLMRKNADGERVIHIIQRQFEALGYKVAIWKLNAAHFGVPQIRHRVFIVGSLYKKIPQPTPQFTLSPQPHELQLAHLKPAITVWEAMSDLPQIGASQGEEEQPYGEYGEPLNEYQAWARGKMTLLHNHVSMKHTKRSIERFRLIQTGTKIQDIAEEYRVRERGGEGQLSEAEYNSNHRHLRPDMVSHTIPASFYSTFIHPMLPRNLTAREAARLQSFPDSYCFKGKRTQVSSKLLAKHGRADEDFLSQYNQIGNAVPPLLAKAIGEHVEAHIRECEGKACSIETRAVESVIQTSWSQPTTYQAVAKQPNKVAYA